jgi:5-methylcytosine-specific restriction enzyme B
MPLPKNLSKDHLLKAIEKIDKEGIPPDAQSKFYDVTYNNKLYPPKLIVSYANLFANGQILNRESFAGGKDTQCFELLEKNGFTIVPKTEIFQTIIYFLNRAHNDPNNLKKKDFIEEFKGLKVDVGFGQGNQATIPWIALLGAEQRVSNGIYPVYLYYKKQQTLILAYGISETHPPLIKWSVKTESIENYFVRLWDQKPKRYGESFVFADYKIDPTKQDFGLEKEKVDNDIEKIIEEYKQTLTKNISKINNNPPAKKVSIVQQPFQFRSFLKELGNAHLSFPDHTVLRFVTALATKPFVILTGLSGSGKTKLALAFAKWITESKSQTCIIPVGADWTNREPLLGFPNMQLHETYVFPENGALNIILEATENRDKPYFLILDEMNLSHVERYFADFLSCMESGDCISLHPGSTQWNNGKVPPSISLPPNLFIIGTVNIDETTYMFSPKVLDRASVIEFRISEAEMEAFLNAGAIANLDNLKHKGMDMAGSFVKLASDKKSLDKPKKSIKDEIMKFFSVLKQAGAEFGFRTASEMMLFSIIANKIDTWNEDELIDVIIMQKLLPKLHGSRRKLEPILKKLAEFCLRENKNIDKYLKTDGQQLNIEKDDSVKYKLSLNKIQRMYDCMIEDSFTSYAEAK